jgi:hypothetical protein
MPPDSLHPRNVRIYMTNCSELDTSVYILGIKTENKIGFTLLPLFRCGGVGSKQLILSVILYVFARLILPGYIGIFIFPSTTI